jgi:hypothetical protein
LCKTAPFLLQKLACLFCANTDKSFFPLMQITPSMNRASRWKCCLHITINLNFSAVKWFVIEFCAICMHAVHQETRLANLSHAKDCPEIKLHAQKFSSLTESKKSLSQLQPTVYGCRREKSWRRKRRIARLVDGQTRRLATRTPHQPPTHCV